MADDANEYLTPEQAAEFLQVNRETIYRHIRSGQLRAARFGRLYRIARRDLETNSEASGRGTPAHQPGIIRDVTVAYDAGPGRPQVMNATHYDPVAVAILRRAGIAPHNSVVLTTAGTYKPGMKTLTEREMAEAIEYGMAADAEDYHEHNE